MRKERPVLLVLGMFGALLSLAPILMLIVGALNGAREVFVSAYQDNGLVWIAACFLVPISAFFLWLSRD